MCNLTGENDIELDIRQQKFDFRNLNCGRIHEDDLNKLLSFYDLFEYLLSKQPAKYVYFVFERKNLYIISDIFITTINYVLKYDYEIRLIIDYETYKYCAKTGITDVTSTCISDFKDDYCKSVYKTNVANIFESKFEIYNFEYDVYFIERLPPHDTYKVHYNIGFNNYYHQDLIPIINNDKTHMCYMNKYIYFFLNNLFKKYKLNENQKDCENILYTSKFYDRVYIGHYLHISCKIKKIEFLKDILLEKINNYNHLKIIYNEDIIIKIFLNTSIVGLDFLEWKLFSLIPYEYFNNYDDAIKYLATYDPSLNEAINLLYEYNYITDEDDIPLNKINSILIANLFLYKNCTNELKELFYNLMKQQ